MEQKKLIKNLVKVIRRLSVDQSLFKIRHQDDVRKVVKKIESKKTEKFSLKDKRFMSEYYSDMMWYGGKIAAYGWVLCQLVGDDKKANEILLQGFEGDKKYDKYGNRK